MRAGGRVAQDLDHRRLDRLADDVLPLARLGVGDRPRQPEDVGQEALGQAMSPDHLLGEHLPLRRELDHVLVEVDEALALHASDHLRDRRPRHAHPLGDTSLHHADVVLVELVDRLAVLLERGMPFGHRLSLRGAGDLQAGLSPCRGHYVPLGERSAHDRATGARRGDQGAEGPLLPRRGHQGLGRHGRALLRRRDARRRRRGAGRARRDRPHDVDRAGRRRLGPPRPHAGDHGRRRPDAQPGSGRWTTIWSGPTQSTERGAPVGFRGSGHYHDHYRLDDDGRWRFRSVVLTRLRIDPLAGGMPTR